MTRDGPHLGHVEAQRRTAGPERRRTVTVLERKLVQLDVLEVLRDQLGPELKNPEDDVVTCRRKIRR